MSKRDSCEMRAVKSNRRVAMASLAILDAVDNSADQEIKKLSDSEFIEALSGVIKRIAERMTCKKLGIRQ